MNALQREAMAQAQDGQWNLADALELDARAKDRDAQHGFGTCIGGIRRGGRLQWLVYGEIGDCPDCDGAGENECAECGHITDCESCEGTGAAEVEEASVDLIATLNDEVIWRRPEDDSTDDLPDLDKLLTPAWAAEILKEHSEHVSKAETPAATQATLILETT